MREIKKRKKIPRKETRIRDALIHILRNLIKY